MRRSPYILPMLAVLFFGCMTLAGADAWQKFVSGDGTFSLHHPAGWQVAQDEEVVAIEAPDGRQILIITIPYDPGKTAQEYAQLIMGLLADENTGLTVNNWHTEADGDTAYATVTFASDGVAYAGDVLVIRDRTARLAIWFSYSGPAAGYDREAALETLQAVMASLAAGDASEPPATASAAAETEAVAAAFIFMVEFAVGQPLSVEAEQVIITELTRDWGEAGAPEELAAYPMMVQAITALDEQELEQFRMEMAQVLNELLAEEEQTDPAIIVIRQSLTAAQQIVAPGDPPLTAAAASSYAEMIAYAMTLHANPQAGMAKRPQELITGLRNHIVNNWQTLDNHDKAQALAAPYVWAMLRHTLRFGTPEQAADALRILVGLGDGIAAARAAAHAGQVTEPATITAAAGDDLGRGGCNCCPDLDAMSEAELAEHAEAKWRMNNLIMLQQNMGAPFVGILPNPYVNPVYGSW